LGPNDRNLIKSKYIMWRIFAPLAAIAIVAGLTIAPAFGQAFHRAQTEIIPIEGLFDNLDCGQELIDFTGNIHVVSQSFAESDGQEIIRFHVNTHVSFANVRGVGTASGNQYQITDATNSMFNFHAGAGTTTSDVVTFHFVVKGPPTDQPSDLLVHSNVHLTVNANGEVTTSFSNAFAQCT
jgi:hypothetical protein